MGARVGRGCVGGLPLGSRRKGWLEWAGGAVGDTMGLKGRIEASLAVQMRLPVVRLRLTEVSRIYQHR